MNLEGITINILTSRLQEKLLGGKIYKVFMPNKSSLLLLVKTENAVIPLAADFSGASPYLYMPDKTPERPETPPAFCMLLRKHLEEGRITKITQSGLDRVITMEISSIGSARQIISKQLIFELTGKNANIIFVSEGVILDSLKHIGKALSSYRQILPGLAYIAPPPQDGLDILTSAPVDIAAAAKSAYCRYNRHWAVYGRAAFKICRHNSRRRYYKRKCCRTGKCHWHLAKKY